MTWFCPIVRHRSNARRMHTIHVTRIIRAQYHFLVWIDDAVDSFYMDVDDAFPRSDKIAEIARGNLILPNQTVSQQKMSHEFLKSKKMDERERIGFE